MKNPKNLTSNRENRKRPVHTAVSGTPGRPPTWVFRGRFVPGCPCKPLFSPKKHRSAVCRTASGNPSNCIQKPQTTNPVCGWTHADYAK